MGGAKRTPVILESWFSSRAWRAASAPRRLLIGLGFGLLLGLGQGGCGCRGQAERPASVPPKTPSLRLYILANAAGALEPCGCVKDMLGGFDHAAALLRSERNEAPNSLLVGAGPMLFMDPKLDLESAAQDRFKAFAIAESFRDMSLLAWSPGYNDWAAGAETLAELGAKSGAHVLAANLEASPGVEQFRVVERGGYKVGIVGVSLPDYAGNLPPGISAREPRAALALARQRLEALGADIRIALLTLPKREAIRLAEAERGFDVIVVGKPHEQGEANDAAATPLLIGGSLVVTPQNHLQSLTVVDLFVRGEDFDFKDASGIEAAERKGSLERRVRELDQRIKQWEEQGVNPADIAARKRDLEQAKKQLAALAKPPAPPKGSFFRIEIDEVRERLGSDPAVAARIAAYYRKVNEHNRVTFKDRVPVPAAADQSGFLGIEQCATCHAEEREFWNGTRHAKAYETLADQHKQFNLDCVGCHVTGYEKPGGSTVTHTDRLEDVQCEVCHGPGSRHPADPGNPALIVRKPARDSCAAQCHHPPHVHAGWDVDAAFARIIGKGHGG